MLFCNTLLLLFSSKTEKKMKVADKLKQNPLAWIVWQCITFYNEFSLRLLPPDNDAVVPFVLTVYIRDDQSVGGTLHYRLVFFTLREWLPITEPWSHNVRFGEFTFEGHGRGNFLDFNVSEFANKLYYLFWKPQGKKCSWRKLRFFLNSEITK